MKHILKCSKCEKYTMQDKCCGVKTISPKPAKFSPENKYGKYRRAEKKKLLEKEGLY